MTNSRLFLASALAAGLLGILLLFGGRFYRRPEVDWLFRGSPQRGERLFNAQCAPCHGVGGAGGRAPELAVAHLSRANDFGGIADLVSRGIPGTDMPSFWFLSNGEIRDVTAYVRGLGRRVEDRPVGNAMRGRAVYAANGCSRCHIVLGEGNAWGPELSAVGLSRSPSHLREAIVEPAAAVGEDRLFRATTAEGARVEGLRVNEDPFTIQLRDAAGTLHSLRKTELRDLAEVERESPMPSYASKIRGADLDDLVAYLASLRSER